ncbi:histidinol-phosphate transaminase [Acidipropionibacterium jensenii]|uniref:Histidinol-phosphate aminotransferase n=1 Tax=Acidipropionibacterium jensenii TaxID=1749 RepID=A0A3Q9UJE2_9ACTN|nr:histidinol-phosphate transaminase [Acidipropionibacterium jensenii]AZZ39498.1 histidinol-phosphate transaminase [Acidipropionibacterium jensenii]
MSSDAVPTAIARVNPITLAELPLRPELVGEEPYGAPQLDVPVCLNVNENAYPPSEAVRRDMAHEVARQAAGLNRYPDREATGLRTDLAEYIGFGVGADQVWPANGSNEVMTQILQAFGGPGRTLLTFTPTYSMYPEYARNTHTDYVTVPRDEYFGLDAERVLTAIRDVRADVVLITTPNNPTGTATPVAVIDEVCAGTDAIVVVDEAYQEFNDTPEDSAIALLPKYGRLIVVRTLSKAFALAGGRVGYAVAAPAVIDALRIVRLPYHLSATTQTVARVALRHAPEMLARVDELRETRAGMEEWLRMRGFAVVPSQSNFLLFGRFVDRHAVWAEFLEHGVLIREVGPEGYLRVCAGTPAEVDAFQRAVLEIAPHAEMMKVADSEAISSKKHVRTSSQGRS